MVAEAKLFRNGQSQAVRLPKELRFKGKSVYINKVGSCVILIPKDDPWRIMFEAGKQFSDDFMAEGRSDPPLEERKDID